MADTPRVTVPVEPTEAMIEAGNRALSPWIAPAMHAAEAYRAMLSAAPAPEGGVVSGCKGCGCAPMEHHADWCPSLKGGNGALATREEAPASRLVETLNAASEKIAANPDRAAEIRANWTDGMEAPAEAGEGPCTCCDDTGITIQTERPCSCLAGDPFRAQPKAREGDDERPIEATWTDGVTNAYVNLSAALSAERTPWRQKLGLRIASVRYLDVDHPQAREEAQPVLTVWYGSMPESNGRQNWTATLRRVNPTDKWDQGFCFARSEYPERVRYEADRMRWIIGELAEKPDILAYDEKAHSGYVAPNPPATEAEKLRLAVEALKPLAKEGDGYADTVGDEYLIEGDVTDLTLGDLRRAATALAALQQEGR